MSSRAHIVYVVDDEPSVRNALVRLLQSAGHHAEGFSGVEEFLESDHPFTNACVIADIRMPNVSGLVLPGRLAEMTPRPPVILLTAFDTQETREEARHVGAAAYFRKPVDDQALLDAIEWAINPRSTNSPLENPAI